MSELEPRRRPKKELAARHIPQEIVPVPFDEVRGFIRDALSGTSLVNPYARLLTGWALFEPHLRLTEVDATHTRIELDMTGTGAAETLLFVQRRAEIDRFFVALRDELDRRERWRPRPSLGSSTDLPELDQ